MATKIFINYRRHESLKDARHLATLLAQSFGESAVFIDTKGLDGAPDWLHELERQLTATNLMISLICPNWVDIKDDSGKRRIDNDNDFVRYEINRALTRDIPIVPVLVDGAQMPTADSLPTNLLLLTRPQAEFLRKESFDADIARIALRIRQELGRQRQRGVPHALALGSSALALTLGIVFGATFHIPGLSALTDEQIRAMLTETQRELNTTRDALEANRAKATEAASGEAKAQAAQRSTASILAATAKDLEVAVKARTKIESELKPLAGERDKLVMELKRTKADLDVATAQLKKFSDQQLAIVEDRKKLAAAKQYYPVLFTLPAAGKTPADALGVFADIRSRYQTILEGREPIIKEVDLGERGFFYRVLAGPPNSKEQAVAICEQLKAQGYKDCWIHGN